MNCGLRISELIGLDITDIHDDALRVLGKGNKVRVVSVSYTHLARLGDVIQLRFSGDVFQHSPVVVQPNSDGDPAKILVAAHSADVDWRPLSTYDLSLIHI